MTRNLRCALISSLLLLTACSSAPSELDGEIYLAENSIVMEGHLSTRMLEELIRLTDEKPEIAVIQVTSKSGDPMAAMQMGYLLERKQLAVEITDLCLEVCANYIFTAAAERIIHPNAIIAWSGGALDNSWILQWQSYILPGIQSFVTRYSDTYLRRETRFFDRINVDQHITVYGFDPQIGCVSDSEQGFYFNIADLISMGIGPIQFSGDINWRDFELEHNQYCRVDLSNRLLLIN